jgi:hypothetical protein
MRGTHRSHIGLVALGAWLLAAGCAGGEPAGREIGDPTRDPTTSTQPPVSAGAAASATGRGGVGASVGGLYAAFEDCDALLSWTKDRLLERVTPYGLGGGGWPVMEGDLEAPGTAPAGLDGRAQAAPTTTAASAAPAAGETSATNTQEAGVDEGDIAETDGRFVYSIIDNHLRSVDLAGSRLVSDQELPPGEYQMVLAGDSLLVVAQEWSSPSGEAVVSRYRVAAGLPDLVGRTHLEGTALAVRSIDRTARLVLSQSIVHRIPFVRPRTDSEEDERVALAANKRVIADLTVDDLLPRAYDVDASGASGALRPALDCADIGHPTDFSGFGIVWVAATDLSAPERPPVGVAGVVADGQTVYASADTLYVGTQQLPDVTGDTVPVQPPPTKTAIHAFALDDPAGARYLASGEVDGIVLNQYSMSENAGYLRIATTTDVGGFGASRESGVHILQRRDDLLTEVGSIGGLGAGEQIQAVRFLGDRAYVVTFRQVDPLYVLDLSQPTAPRLVGQLKIPGYSTYLHPVGDGLLLGVGFAGDEAGVVGGSQIGLFDVRDPAAPRQLVSLPIGQSSEATFDPHAFLWWPATGQVVVPKELVCTRQADCTSAVVFKLEGETLSEQGRIFHWYPIRRSMIADGRLVTVSAGGVRVNDLATLSEQERVDFGLPDGSGLLSG